MNIDVMDVWKQTREVLALRREDPDEAYRRLVSLYTGYLSGDLSPGDRGHLMSEFASMQSLLDRKDEARATVDQSLELFPNSVVTLLHASNFFTYDVAAPETAVKLAQRAVLLTESDGELTIYALNHLCRIARRACRFDVMSHAMKRLLATPPRAGLPMQHIECDYLKSLPEGAVPPTLVQALLARARPARDAGDDQESNGT